MKAVYFEQGRVSVRELRKPRRPRGYSLIRTEVAGICSTDLQLLAGYYGFSGVPGHEFVGVVQESDRVELMGRRVVGDINLACGLCAWCARGLRRHCPRRTVLGILGHPGAFQEYFTLPDENLHPVPRGLEITEAVFAEPLAAARRVTDQVRIPRGAAAAVLGDGKLGLLITRSLLEQGIEVHLFGRNAENLAIARGWGARVSEQAPRAEFRYVVEATGTPHGLAAAVAATEPCGHLILKSTTHAGVEMDTAPMVVKELNITGSRCGDLRKALPLLPRFNTSQLVAATYPLEQAPKAIEHARMKGVLKVLLSF